MWFVGSTRPSPFALAIGLTIVGIVGIVVASPLRSQEPTVPATAAPPNLKIVKLLWKAQPNGAATALEKALDQALTRRETKELVPHLTPLSNQFVEAIALGSSDPRWVPSVAALAILDNHEGKVRLSEAVRQTADANSKPAIQVVPAKREWMLRVWLSAQPDEAKLMFNKRSRAIRIGARARRRKSIGSKL